MAGRTVIITGAARGIGEACARRFAEAGDRLVLADKNEAAGRAVADVIGEQDAQVSFVSADIADRLDVHNIIADALETFGGVDVLVNAAIEHFAADFLETGEDDFDRVMATNLRGAFLINQAFARQLSRQFDASEGAPGDVKGAIVNVMTVEAVTARADQVAFVASQGGLHQLTKAVALAVSAYGGRANAVGVGAVKSAAGEEPVGKEIRQEVPLARIGDPEEVAEAVFFLASPAASFIPGQSSYVDGGRMVRSVRALKKSS